MEKRNKDRNYVKKDSRHIRWNWEQSPDNQEMVRYHLVVIDDKDRGGKINEILKNAQFRSVITEMFEEIRNIEGKVEGTKFRYLLKTFDTRYNPVYMNPKNVFKNVKRDKDLYERKIGSIEDYVADIYG